MESVEREKGEGGVGKLEVPLPARTLLSSVGPTPARFSSIDDPQEFPFNYMA